MVYSLSNTNLTASINLKGAELSKLVDKDGVNYVWTADAKYWGRHTPMLFPFIGRIVDGAYTYEGNSYTIPSHGFARDMDFEVTNQTDTKITFTLKSSDETKKMYPFDFTLNVHYELNEKTLSVSYEVINNDSREMIFKIGGHPAFNCPLLDGEVMEDYYLKFPEVEEATLLLPHQETTLVSRDTSRFSGDTLHLSPDLFAVDAVIFKGLKSTYVTLENTKNDKKLRFDFDGFPLLGIWSKADRAPFVCIEPWHGHTDFVGESVELTEKEDTVKLSSNSTFECTQKITIA
ncbi:MAG: hypothetical protein ATN36_05895 [Epulopiscium sp. Nele67-Bin005]|nr:MAG: hypothetical protein ATN36_05895 [Epulopiscium sp. Nele67-Bin005]